MKRTCPLKQISMFLPCYNEELNIAKTILEAISILNKITDTYEIIVVNDGSRDQTAAVVERLTKIYPHICLINHHGNRGYGAALRSGILNSHYEIIFFADADGQFDLQELNKFLPLIENYDLVLGYRINRKDRLSRKINAWIYNQTINALFSLRVKDIDCGFKMFRKKILSDIEIKSDGAVASAEILIKLQRLGYKFTEVGVHHYPRMAGNPTGGKLSVIFKAFLELYKLWNVPYS